MSRAKIMSLDYLSLYPDKKGISTAATLLITDDSKKAVFTVYVNGKYTMRQMKEFLEALLSNVEWEGEMNGL